MALQIVISYQNAPVIYDVTVQEDDIYLFRLNELNNIVDRGYVPQKLVIRRKGKIWISDLEDHQELISALTDEIQSFNSNKPLA